MFIILFNLNYVDSFSLSVICFVSRYDIIEALSVRVAYYYLLKACCRDLCSILIWAILSYRSYMVDQFKSEAPSKENDVQL